jgi:hypothetical protein
VTTHEIITTLAAVLSIAYSQKVKKRRASTGKHKLIDPGEQAPTVYILMYG